MDSTLRVGQLGKNQEQAKKDTLLGNETYPHGPYLSIGTFESIIEPKLLQKNWWIYVIVPEPRRGD